jgi:hypothetical protein
MDERRGGVFQEVEDETRNIIVFTSRRLAWKEVD